VVAGAGIVMCTLTTAYLSPLLADQRFDVLIAEEAGMATLPALFHAACLCRPRAILAGDPRQLPPTAPASDARVRPPSRPTRSPTTSPPPAACSTAAPLTWAAACACCAAGSLTGRAV